MLYLYRHEAKFLTYTVTKRDRIRKLMDANQVHLVHEEKKKALAEDPPRELQGDIDEETPTNAGGRCRVKRLPIETTLGKLC